MIEIEIYNNEFGDTMYFIKGTSILHRENGPAVIWTDGRKEYFLNDKLYENIKSDEEWIIKNIIE